VLKDVEKLDVDDVGTCVLEFDNGAIGSVSNSCIVSQGHSVGLHVFARDLVIEVGTNSLKISEPGVSTTRTVRADAYMAETKAFLRAIAEGDASGIRADYSEGVKSLQISLAVLESAAKHQPVVL
jgi:predicted dehydrogenase